MNGASVDLRDFEQPRADQVGGQQEWAFALEGSLPDDVDLNPIADRHRES